jgi:hypothetical protein
MDAIILEYSRQPKTTSYEAKIQSGTVETRMKSLECSNLLLAMTGVSLAQVLEELHNYMIQFPEARVFMLQTPYQAKSIRVLPIHELSSSMRDLIRDHLDEAKSAFAPIVITRGKEHEPTQSPSTRI